MRLHRVTVKNFRTLENVTISFTSDYCTLSGHNNAGKSSIIRLINNLLSGRDSRPWMGSAETISYSADRTQWLVGNPAIDVTYEIHLNREDDTSLISFIERLSGNQHQASPLPLIINITADSKEGRRSEILIDNHTVDDVATKEILAKLRSSRAIFLHNSTRDENEYFFGAGRMAVLYDATISPEDQKAISEAEVRLQKQVKKVAKAHKSQFTSILGRLSDKYDVDLSALDLTPSRRFPLAINLTDKSVDLPLPEWGSGTQNRTHILMSILQANQIKTGIEGDERITPIVIIEEPESFLHPSAQAEFGSLLQALSSELQIQIIVATHSPFMLNQVNPSSNILLRRKIVRRRTLGTEIVDTSGENWMAPFADQLGIIPPEFETWRGLLASRGARMLLVEGEIDKDYFEHLRENYGDKFGLPTDVEVVSYGGKNALNNTAMVKFVLSRIERYFITFDLDAAQEVRNPLMKIGLKEGEDFMAIGVSKPGRDAIEGMLPERVISAVLAKETDLVLALGSGNGNDRKNARANLKKKFLAEFKKDKIYSEVELRPLFQIGRSISRRFS